MSKYKIIDAHQDIAFNSLHITDKDFLKENRLDESNLLPMPQLNQSDYVRLVNSGVKVVFGVSFPYRIVEKGIYTDQDFAQKETNRQLDFYNDLETRSEEKVKIIKSTEDLNFVLNTENVLGVVLLVEDAVGIDITLNNIESLYNKGLRMVGIVWNRDNQFGGGTDSNNGITEAGIKLLGKMDELGMILDTAHMNKTLFWDALKIFKGPVMNSHTCTYTINPHRRNLDDEQLKALAERGGVLGIAFVPEFLNKKAEEATLADVVTHIKHAVGVCGIDSIAFGSDFDGMSWPEYLPTLKDSSQYFNLIEELEKLYSKEEVQKIIYGNWKKFLTNSLV